MAYVIRGRVLIAGNAGGELVYTDEPFSFWGGFDAKTGEIIDQRHKLWKQNLRGKIFALPYARGSSTGSGLLLEGIRVGTAPAAMILAQADAILSLGAIMARELYGKTMPLVVVDEKEFAELRSAQIVNVKENGEVWCE